MEINRLDTGLDEDFFKEAQAINLIYEVVANEFPFSNFVESIVDMLEDRSPSDAFFKAFESANALEKKLIENADIDITRDIGILVLGLNKTGSVVAVPPGVDEWKNAKFGNNKDKIGWVETSEGQKFIAHILSAENLDKIPVHNDLKAGLRKGSISNLVMVHQFRLSEIALAALKSLFDLTPAEIKLCKNISQGMTLAQAAEQQGVVRETVKTHLKNIFSKTGVKKQSELIKVLTQIAAAAAIQDLSASKKLKSEGDNWESDCLSVQNVFGKNRYGDAISYSVYGDKNGEPIVFLHHGIGSRIHSGQAAKAAKEKGFLVFQPDRPGFGHSDMMPVMDSRFNAEFLEDFCAQIGVKSAKFIAHGIAGKFILDAAPYLDGLIEQLYLYAFMGPDDCRPEQPGSNIWQKLVQYSYDNPRLLVNFTKIGVRRISQRTLIDHYQGSPADLEAVKNKAVFEHTKQYISLSYRQNYQGSAYEYSQRNAPLNLSPSGKYDFPVTSIYGAQDIYTDPSLATAYFDRFPDAKIVVAPGRGELFPQSNFGEFLDFCERLDRGLRG